MLRNTDDFANKRFEEANLTPQNNLPPACFLLCRTNPSTLVSPADLLIGAPGKPDG